MARFNTGSNQREGIHSGQPSLAAHTTSPTGSSLQARKVALEGRQSGGMASSTPSPKPSFLKGAASNAGAAEENADQEFPKPKSLVSRVQNANEGRKPPFPKQPPLKPKPLEAPQDNIPKPAFPKVPLKKPSVGNIVMDATPPFPKLPPTQAKPSPVTDDPNCEDGGDGSVPGPSKMPPLPKQKSSIKTMQAQLNKRGAEESGGVKSIPGLGRKPSGFQASQSVVHQDDGSEDGMEGGVKSMNSHTPAAPKPIFTAQKPGFVRKPLGSTSQNESDDPSAPKKISLPNIFALGSPPPKPNRPPFVSLEKFRNDAESMSEDPGTKTGPFPPPPPNASHPVNHVAPPLASHPAAPSLPPRPPGPPTQPEEESYDDVGVMNSPPPPPPAGHPRQKLEESGSDGEMYEDLDERWAAKEKEKTKKQDKEEKKRLEQEKKEQKEKEKKEQEIRKRFKLTGPIQVIHQVKVRVDCKGGKNDLSLSQGDLIEIVRTTDNPGGRWLGRKQDGSYGYVKIECVEINYDILKRQQKGALLPGQEGDGPELYDDVGIPENTWLKGKEVAPYPLPEDGDIYDDVENPSSRTPEGPSNTTCEEIYDDVDSQGFPPPPPIISLPQMKSKEKVEERDPKKQKKFEKEEKEFRKKFKFEGEIQVLYQVNIVSTLTTKKWGSKDLPLKPGEKIDIIVKLIDNKLIGRNQDGKIGYVSTSNIMAEESDIYDDVGEECIYDND
ncbi:FYN-binding protein 1 [Megalops cyprinoides]|uniref:FYN-binding protein 1 n=1 Tax=Megalops cyprinoides TaxID=118141 RepID=UPI00186560A5|nr:FYN-binding protein 1 [Megalops cyprinoides]